MALRAELVSVAYRDSTVLHPTDLSINAGEVVGLIGPNGAGKSTLLRALANLQPLHGGSVLLDDQPLTDFDRSELARSIAYLPQLAECHWPLSVEHVVALGREPHHQGSGLDESDLQAIENALSQADVRHLIGRTVTQLSGGEKTRVMLARALATQARFLLADEPTAGLDAQHQLDLMALLRQQARSGCGIVVVMHELHLAMRYCDRLVLLHEGRCVADGAAAEVLCDEHLAAVYGIQARSGVIDGEPWLLPWARIPAD